MKTLVDAKNSKCQTLLALFQNGGSYTACVQLELNPALPAVLRFGSRRLSIVATSHPGGGAKAPAAAPGTACAGAALSGCCGSAGDTGTPGDSHRPASLGQPRVLPVTDHHCERSRDAANKRGREGIMKFYA